ncbi:MAG TPA: FAD-binding protein, partial [Reyranella sp.]|nr:FAD-binding protein [Reyranella sp.]
GFLDMNVTLDDAIKLPLMTRSWKVKRLLGKVILQLLADKLRGRDYTTAGAALQGRLLKAGLDAGVELRTDSPVSELLRDGDKVTGVVAAGRRIGARLGVLVNAGGFAQNQTMRDEWQPGTRAAWSNTAEGDTGEMIVEMERLGATLGQMDQMVGYQSTLAPGWEKDYVFPSGQTLTGKPGAILVDQSGVRYMNEGGSYELYCQTMLERHRTVAAVPSWAVFDSRYAGLYQVANQWVRKRAEAWREAGYLKQGDTIEELAERMGVPANALKGTVERWNRFVDGGEDKDFHRGAREYDKWLGDPFHRPNPALGRIDRAPFYAVPIVPGDVSTFGGVVTDALGRVTAADGSPIPGLYATGTSTASVMGGVYPGAGASIGPAMAFAYIAAKHAAGLDNQL